MGNTLYLECYSGISGDMVVGALLDLGARQEVLIKVLKSLPVDGFDVKIGRVMKSGIDACDFDVVLDETHENHDHDMEYLYGHRQEDETHYEIHPHHHSETGSSGNHRTHGENSCHHHAHRGLPEIISIIQQGDMTKRAKQLAIRIFEILAQAESEAHNCPVEKVHFHEVGAVDSIVDIISVAVCLDDLDITDVVVSELYEGKGTVRCQHGILPVPVPAVLNIIQAHGLTIRIMDRQGEYVTPTGAAIVAATKTMDALPDGFVIQRIGIGAGKRVYDGPGVVRGMLIEG